MLPILVYAAKLCPPDVEASMFAIFMGMSNLGNDTGLYLGSGTYLITLSLPSHYPLITLSFPLTGLYL